MKKVILGSVALAVLAVAPAALAHSPSGSTEHHEFSCAAPDAEYPPTSTQCQNGETTYTTGGTNDVRCADGEFAAAGDGGADDVLVYGDFDSGEQSGYLETCTEEGPVEGRAVLSGSSDGFTVTADGDKDNDGPATGWARVTVDGDGPSVACANTAQDSSHPSGTESQADCG